MDFSYKIRLFRDIYWHIFTNIYINLKIDKDNVKKLHITYQNTKISNKYLLNTILCKQSIYYNVYIYIILSDLVYAIEILFKNATFTISQLLH